MNSSPWDERVDRAKKLIPLYPSAAQGLKFYVQVAEFQRRLYAEVQKALAQSTHSSALPSLRGDLDVFVLLPHFSEFLRVIEQSAPEPLAAASAFARRRSDDWRTILENFWQDRSRSAVAMGPGAPADTAHSSEAWLAWIFLQPYAEYLASRAVAPARGTPSTCPICGSRPIVGVLRQEGDGAKKLLVCMLCAREWNFRRVYCPSCGEEREPRMAFYCAPEIPHVRVDVCDTCHTYVKTVDLTKSGLAVPVVDDLATLPLDLWARERGYGKLQTNILGI
jgi:formate dehydrogenase accessory protein FdhE